MLTMNLDEFRALASRLDRAPSWGPDDKLGALNFVTLATTLRAVASVTTGEVISCVNAAGSASVGWDMVAIETSTETAETWVAVNEMISFPQHGAQSMTHMDALAHFIFDGHGYAGHGPSNLTPTGVISHDIASASEGVVTRGLLIDLPRIRGAAFLAPDDRVHLDEVRRWVDSHATDLESGDVLFVRTGRPATSALSEGGYPDVGGLDLDCLEWIHDRECAVIVSDAGMDTTVSPVENLATPWHVMTITRMGVRLVDNADLDALSDASRRHARINFMAVLAPLHLPRATASPINPLAVF